MLIQAGGSEAGQELSARTADIVFSVVNGDKDEAKTAYDGLKARMAKYGREPDELCDPARRDADHRRAPKARPKPSSTCCRAGSSPTNALRLVSQPARPRHLRLSARRAGAGLSRTTQNSSPLRRTLFEMARRENMTLRDLYNVTAAARGHWVI